MGYCNLNLVLFVYRVDVCIISNYIRLVFERVCRYLGGYLVGFSFLFGGVVYGEEGFRVLKVIFMIWFKRWFIFFGEDFVLM